MAIRPRRLRRLGAPGLQERIPLDWILRDDFLTDEPAPLTSPRTCEPGPGTLTMVELDGALAVVSGQLRLSGQATAGFNETGFHIGAVTRSPGIVLAARGIRFTTSVGSLIFGWDNEAGLSTALAHGTIWEGDGNVRHRKGGSTPQLFSYGVDNRYDVAMVLRGVGQHVFVRGDGMPKWRRVWIDDSVITASLYPVFNMARSSNYLYVDSVRIADLVANGYSVFSDDDADMEFSQVTVSDSNPCTFTHSPDFFLRFTVTTMPTSATAYLYFRHTGGNGPRLQIAPDGSGRIDKASGAAVSTCAAGTFTAGSEVTLRVIGDEVMCAVGDTEIMRNAGMDNLTETNGSWTPRGGVFSGFKIWPGQPTGEVQRALDKLMS